MSNDTQIGHLLHVQAWQTGVCNLFCVCCALRNCLEYVNHSNCAQIHILHAQHEQYRPSFDYEKN